MNVGAGSGIALAALSLAACAASPGSHARLREAPAARSGPAPDVSYDWHGLVRVPFGTLLKDSPLALHEVLLFHDIDRDGAADIKECYAVDGAAPRFLGGQPDDYVLCFEHDRLVRIETSVLLPAGEAARVFARGCGLWHKDAGPPEGIDTCDGRDDGVAFSARLAGSPPEAAARVSMMLTAAANPDAVQEPLRTAPREP
jgi:hypothetical protein